MSSVGSMDANASFRRKLSKREKKQLKKQEKLSRMKSDIGDATDADGVAEKLYTGTYSTWFSILSPSLFFCLVIPSPFYLIFYYYVVYFLLYLVFYLGVCLSVYFIFYFDECLIFILCSILMNVYLFYFIF